MTAVHAYIFFHIVFGYLHQGLGLISDYKLCGDPQCESMISHVQAQRDHSAKDCRFLNFKTGDIITVYYKLTGKRNDLWAGSIEKLSGLFPKDAIKVDQQFIDEKKEIEVPTQEFDFICFDENGLVIERSTEFDDLEDLSQETDFNEIQDKPNETEDREPRQVSVQDVSDQNSTKTTQKGGSSWIGSAVSGWFGRNAQSNDEPQDESSEEPFKSRKIVMDIEENHVEEKTNSGTFGWIRGELTNAFGFGNKDLKIDTQDNIKKSTNDEDTSSQQPSPWISMGRDVLDIGEDDTEAATKPKAEEADEDINTEDPSILNPSQNMDVVDNKQRDENNPEDSVENKDGPLEDRRTENVKEKEQVGWYGNMYNRITNLYREEQTKDDEVDGGNDKLESPGSATNTETTETTEKEEDAVKSENDADFFGKVKQDTRDVQSNEEKTGKKENPDEGQFYQMAVFIEVKIYEIASIVKKVVSSLPDDIRPGPDLYGLPWEAVVFTGFLGLLTLLLFSCRFIQSIRSRLYASKETQMAQKVAELLDEKCKVLETFSEVKQKFDKLESTLQNNGMSAQAEEKDSLEVASKKLEQSNAQIKNEIERLQEELSRQNKARKQQEDQLAELEQILRNLEEEAKERKSQLEQDNTTLKIHEINTERLQKNLQVAKEEHAMLLESKEQLVQEAEDWSERLCELEEEMKMCERSHTGMLEDCANKDDRIQSLTECLLKMRDWDSEDESCVDGSTNAARDENGDRSDFHQRQKVQKLIEAAKMSAGLKSMEEDKNRVFAKLADEIKAKEDLQEGIKQLDEQKEVLESESASYASESQKLQQKLQIMTEMYRENELKLHRMLTVEEKERLQKEEKLNKADKKISFAAEELSTYRKRAKDLEEELERTSLAYKNQITSHEKKAHDNWLAARAADRDLAEVKRENSHLRQKLTGAQFKFEILEKDVREGRPLFRGERSSYGPSPLSRPSSETRAFLSPPTLMDGPPRLSPPFMGPGRASRGVVEPPSGGPDFERSGPHSDSGSLSPSWDRERRGPPPPSGLPLPDPGLPFRRPPPGPYPMGPLPPRPPLPPEPYFGDKSDSSFLRNSSSVIENESREGPHSMPGDMRLPPDPNSRMGPPGTPLKGMPPLMHPRDPHFPPRGPYGPSEFFPPRGPGGLPIGMRGPLPPGMFPRAPMPLPQHMGYLPPRHSSDSFPIGPPPRPSPPGSEQPPNQSPSPHDVI
ncbi:cTAGE family member 2-like isoform X2 [Carassius carassius]|uniref:cTAGE family member 2-like isoform X2 n=1 Tax=Carassius carassius TaxID=217509 RepID=UPI00286934FE|nr:cTAGE family member 2-like isoform X2 [Carassius carassius]